MSASTAPAFLDNLTIELTTIPEYDIWGGTWSYKIDRELCRLILESNDPRITEKKKRLFKSHIVDKLDANGRLKMEWKQSSRIELGEVYSQQFYQKSADKYESIGNLGADRQEYHVRVPGLDRLRHQKVPSDHPAACRRAQRV